MYKPQIIAAAGRLILTISASLALFGAARGQTAAVKAETDDSKNDELIELSPFVVDSSKDVGYRANNTLAGTRINTSLRDLAAPVSVVTKDFMNDINATDINDILAFQTGSEGTRDFSATTGQLGRTTDDAAANPNGAIRGRGLTSFDLTRDYFYTISGGLKNSGGVSGIGFDSYNLDSVTISRGPNSILAGLGSPSGIINYSPQLAQLSRNSNEVSLRYGSYNDQRATLNSNVVLVKDKVALRFAAVAANEGFKQEPAFVHNRRLYLTSTIKPFAKTMVRVSYEWAHVTQRRPNTLTPEDDISQWLAVGKPTYTEGSPFSTLLASGQSLTNQAALYNADGTLFRGVDVTGQKAYFQQNLSGVGLFQATRFHDNTYGNWDELNTNPSLVKNKFKTWNFTLDQEIIKDLNLNVSYVREDLDSNSINLFRPDYVTYQIDVNATLPGGAPNPHFGETYMAFRGLDNFQSSRGTNEVGRVSLTYNLDFTNRNKWLGHYNLVAFGEQRHTESGFVQFNSWNTATNTETGRIYYLGGKADNGYRPTTVPPTPSLVTNIPLLNADGTTGTMSDIYQLKSDTRDLTKLRTTAAVAQAYLLKDMLVLTGGIRRDVNYAASSIGANNLAGPYGELARVAATTKSYGAVAHPTKWLDVFYNKSENFVPNAGSVDLLNNTVSSPVGKSKDWGVAFSSPDGKWNAKVGWYKTEALNSYSPTATFPLAQWTLPWLETGYPTGGTGGPFQDLAAKQGIVYKQGMAPNLTTGDSKLGAAYTSDQEAKGMELELTFNPTKNWRLFATVTKQEAKETNIAPTLTAFIEERLAYWKSTPGLWTGQTTTKGWNGVPETGEQLFNNYVLGDYIRYQSADGKPSTQLHKWRGTLVTNYTFTEGFLENFSAGLGMRYIDGAVIGNPVIRNDLGQVVALDLDHPYTSSAQVSVDVWIGYRRKLTPKYTIDLQLRCEDLQSSGGYRAIVANSDGNHSVYTITPERRFYLTTKLQF
ncbi:MAG TPA: TonB-dependent receptor plug domain-containing protein [Opitutaceae bacterium]|nr:TonB-dependent receptor plug domain-containing protein [Opitutaceae bacterium]